MRRLIAPLALFVTLIGAAVPASALTIAHLWSQRWGSGTTETVNGIVVDAS